MYTCIIVLVSILHITKCLEPTFIDIDDDDELSLDEINKGLDLFEGDIMEELHTTTRVKRNAILDKSQLWSMPVPYVLEESLNVGAKAIILQAFDHFRLKTCIDFKPRQSEEYYISLRQNKGCSSHVARVIKGGQIISIGKRCGYLGTIEHELFHTLGFFHEQSRYDRDKYITIMWDNIKEEHKGNFKKFSSKVMTTFNAPYDYSSVLHYSKNAFSKTSARTIVTKLPQYQDIIGQRMEMSEIDVYKLNRLYNCNTSISFMEHCDFSDGSDCRISVCEKGSIRGWKRMSAAPGGPSTDHTSTDKFGGYFMHASTVSGQEGDSAWLETKRMSPSRKCHVQCLQFYYYHSGSQSDHLNIWIREFQNEGDTVGKMRIMGQITGQPSFHWLFHTVPLDAAKSFQIVFEVRKGKDESSGGFSIDDVNLSESECPHHVWQIKDFDKLLMDTDYNSHLLSPRIYSPEGYRYQVVIALREAYFGLYVRLVSGDYDSQLEWPCPWRQITIIMLDKNTHIQKQMSKQIDLSTDPAMSVFDNPRNVGRQIFENEESVYENTAYGVRMFHSLKKIKSRDFLKGGTAVFLLSMKDISSLQHGSSLACPKRPPNNLPTSYPNNSEGPCNRQDGH